MTSSTPSVSIIIPAYEASNTIGRAVASLLAQTRLPDEIIIVDDGSPDDLALALKPFRNQIVLLRKPNGGAASARNHGLDHARGELLAFLDADDYVEPARFERQIAVFRSHPEVGLCAGRFYLERPQTGEPTRNPPKPKRELRVYAESRSPFRKHTFDHDRVLHLTGSDVFFAASRVWTSTVMVRRDALAGRRFDTGLKTAEDIDLWIRLVEGAPLYLLSEPLATHVLVPGSLSRSDVSGDCRNMLAVIRRHGHLLGRVERRHWEAQVFRRWAAGYLGVGERRKALPPAWQRWLRQPWSPQACWILCKCMAGVLGGLSGSTVHNLQSGVHTQQ